MASPAVLRNLVEQYEALAVLHAERGGVQARQRMEDVAYTLCVTTGTRDVDGALAAARRQLGTGTGTDTGPSGTTPSVA